MDTPRELEWYLRDHFFRQSGKGRAQFARSQVAAEMATLYLRFRGYDVSQLSDSLAPVIDDLVSMHVLAQAGDTLELASKLLRMQCAKCFYVSYFSEAEPKLCQRCSRQELHEFPRKK